MPAVCLQSVLSGAVRPRAGEPQTRTSVHLDRHLHSVLQYTHLRLSTMSWRITVWQKEYLSASPQREEEGSGREPQQEKEEDQKVAESETEP